MNFLISYGLNLVLLLLTFLVFLKSGLKIKRSRWCLLIGFLFLTTPLFHYQPTNFGGYFLPFLSLIFLFLITIKKLSRLWVIWLGLFLIFLASCYATNILAFPFQFQPQKTILANRYISESITRHRIDALYLPYTLRPLLFNQLGYVYYLISNSIYYLSPLDFNNTFLIVNLFPLVVGALKSLSSSEKRLRIFIFGSLAITSLVMGFSRPVNVTTSFFTIFPLIFYLIFSGLEEIKINYYLPLLFLNFYIQTAI